MSTKPGALPFALTKWCVEFGAWDGVHLSNTCNLIRHHDFSAVLIEGDGGRVADLKRNFPQDNVIKVNKFVRLETDSSLESILDLTLIPNDFDLLSIDIDGCDYWIFKGLDRYQPKIVVIEFNPTMPNSIRFIQPPDFSIKWGSSARSLCDLAEDKGYGLFAVTACNAIFVRNEYLPSLGYAQGQSPTLESLRDDEDSIVYLFSGYDGTVMMSNDMILPWHSLVVSTSKIQVLPRVMRKFPGDFGILRRFTLRVIGRVKFH
jgi:hypothetical protein